MSAGHAPLDDGVHRVQHIRGGQVVAGGQLGPAAGFAAALGFHQAAAGFPQLQTRRRVDGVVDAAVAGHETAQQLAVGGVDDGVCPQPGDIPLPERQPRVGRSGGQSVSLHHPFGLPFGCEEGVLHFQKGRVEGPGRTDVHQGPQQPALFLRAGGAGDVLAVGPLAQQSLQQDVQALLLCHRGALLSTAPTGHASKQAPQCRQCSCRMTAGFWVTSMHPWGQWAAHRLQPMQASVTR